MAQSVNLSVSGIYTSGNDLNGLPQGALNEGVNVESRYKNTLEPRRGFDGLPDSGFSLTNNIRMTNFLIDGEDRLIALTAAGDLFYYDEAEVPTPWEVVPGFSTGITPPNAINGKSRFVRAAQNLYVTSQDGVRSLSSGSGALMIRAGVPKGLNLEAETNGDSSGFFNNNTVLTTTATTTLGGAILTNLGDTTGITEDLYVAGAGILAGTTVSSITPAAVVIAQTGDTTAGSTSITNLASNAGIVPGLLVTGQGIPDGAKVSSIGGVGPYTVVLDVPAFQDDTGVVLTFTAPLTVTMSANATGTATVPVTFYSGAQVGYRMVFGRVETDINGGSITRLGAPSAIAIANNIASTSTNVEIMGTLPKNAEDEITFVQLYRSAQTASIDVSPLDQYNLVYERELVAGDFTARVITIEDTVPDSLVGIPLYAGSDREGILQSNDPPPMCWDMCTFRDFALYGNATQPSTLEFTILSVGAPDGIQIGDEITIAGTFLGTPYTETYTAAAAENAAAREFEVVTSGTPSQDITDTANSLIRVINFDEDLPVHAILISSTNDLPGQILLEADDPTFDTFNITADLHQDAYDPELDGVTSDVNTVNNGVYVSKAGEIEAVPATNLIFVGDTSSNLLRLVPLRDYVIALKTDGIYKIQGLTPDGLIVNPFDLTTKIIGADTAVALNSAVWMFSNQGVVSISDGGVDAKSIPIDDQLNVLIGSFVDNLTDVSFAVGYESDRKYILSVPNGENAFTERQYVFNYITNSWTTWDRNLRTAFIHSNEGRLYISRADETSNAVSVERKTATYRDYVDEGIDRTITNLDSIDDFEIVLDDVTNVEVGDILFQDSSTFSPIVDVDSLTNTVTVQTALGWALGDVEVLGAFECQVIWKQVFGDNPAFVRQFSEGLALFKNTRFNTARVGFLTDFSLSTEYTDIVGTSTGLWGLFPWGSIPWGGTRLPSNIRFYIPQNKQLGSYIMPSMIIKQGYSDFKFQGLSISYTNVSQEVGR